MATADFLKECMSLFGPMPIDDFNRAWCVVCSNRECSRSAANAMQFDRRVAAWKDRLFLNVPRAADGDSRFDYLRNNKFLPMEGTVGGSVNTASPPRFEQVSPDQGKEIPGPVPEVVLKEVTVVAPTSATPAPTTPTTPAAKQPLPDNTSFQQGSFLSKKPEETVMKPGDTFTFGSDE